jgi:Bacterial sugar transferase
MCQISGGLRGSAGSASLLDAARGGWVRMSGFAVPGARYDRQVSGWARGYLRKAQLLASDHSDGVLFKPRKDPRVTAVGAHLRRWLVDELPQRFNVFLRRSRHSCGGRHVLVPQMRP